MWLRNRSTGLLCWEGHSHPMDIHMQGDARSSGSREGPPAKLSSRITPWDREMLATVSRTPSHPKWQEERVLQRKATFLSARFLTISCIFLDSVPICCRFSKNLFYTEKVKQRSSMVKIEPLYQGNRSEVGRPWKVWSVFIPPMNMWTFEPAVEPYAELEFLLMATWPAAPFTLKGANLFQQPASFVCIEDLIEVWTLGFAAWLRSTSWNVLTSVSHCRTWWIFSELVLIPC